MDCAESQTYLLDRRRGALSEELRARIEAHLAGCEACRRYDGEDKELSILLESRLPRPRAPDVLRRAVEKHWGPESTKSTPRRGAARTLGTMAAGAALAILAVFAWRASRPSDVLVAEAVNDHLRVLYSDHPLEVESGGIHQVKPWFEGRLDFAPVVSFAGDQDFPLQGGAIAYFVDRKAATFVFKRRLHVITLFVFRAEGLPWPALGNEAIGAVRGALQTSRGFHVLLWRNGDLGYGLVSDVDESDMRVLAAKID
jgi:anti-sigma factor RsiW